MSSLVKDGSSKIFGGKVDILKIFWSMYFLSKNLCDFNSGQGAAITDFTSSGIPDHFTNLGGRDIFKFVGDWGSFIVEQSQDFVVVRDGTSSQVTDKTMVALSGFGVVQNSKNSLVIAFSRTLGTADKLTNEETFEDSNTS